MTERVSDPRSTARRQDRSPAPGTVARPPWRVRSKAGGVLGKVLAAGRERARRVERTGRTEAHTTLEQVATLHRLVMLATHDIVWDADLVNDATVWSGAIEEVLGYPDRTRHDSAWWESKLHPEDRHRVTRSLADATDQPDVSSWESEYRFRCLEGEYKTLYCRGLIIRDTSGTAVRMVGSMMDFTVQKRTEAVLKQALLQAEAAREAKSRFLANVSHELRTPLTSILGVNELLLDTELDPTQQAFVETIHRSGQRLLAIINELLDFSKADAGFLTAQGHAFHLPSLLAQLDAEFTPLATQKALAFDVTMDENVPPQFVGDELRIAQLLQNLLANAVKFTDSGKVALHVRPGGTGRGAYVEFVVTDSGVGLSEEEQLRLFEPFTQADESLTRKHGGTGLGLAICKQLAEAMGGTITATSRRGEGSTFTFRHPVAPAPS